MVALTWSPSLYSSVKIEKELEKVRRVKQELDLNSKKQLLETVRQYYWA